MKLSTVLKVFGMFAVAMSGKVLPEAKADFVQNITVCNDFTKEDNVIVTFGQLSSPPVIQPQTCETFSVEENCKPLSYTEKYGIFSITNKWGTSPFGSLSFHIDGDIRLAPVDVNSDGCVFPEYDNTFTTAPPINFTCIAPEKQTPKLRR